MSAYSGNKKFVLCLVCNKPGHLNCLNLDRQEFHIDFNEDEVDKSDDENLFTDYTIKNLQKDEKIWKKQQKKLEEEISSYEEYDGVGVNIVNSKQMKKIKMQTSHNGHIPKHLRKFYTFPVEDMGCTESQLLVKYCGNCGRKDHHFKDCEYEENPLYINYQRKTYRRDKINKEQINQSRYRDNRRDNRHENRHDNRNDRYDNRRDDRSSGSRKNSWRDDNRSSHKDRSNGK